MNDQGTKSIYCSTCGLLACKGFFPPGTVVETMCRKCGQKSTHKFVGVAVDVSPDDIAQRAAAIVLDKLANKTDSTS